MYSTVCAPSRCASLGVPLPFSGFVGKYPSDRKYCFGTGKTRSHNQNHRCVPSLFSNYHNPLNRRMRARLLIYVGHHWPDTGLHVPLAHRLAHLHHGPQHCAAPDYPGPLPPPHPAPRTRSFPGRRRHPHPPEPAPILVISRRHIVGHNRPRRRRREPRKPERGPTAL